MAELPTHMRPDRSFQGLILALQRYWADYGCVILQPYDMEVGAGTFHPATTLRALGPNRWDAAYVQPSRRPKDGRYGENPNRLQHYYQFQVILKPSPPDLQELYLKSLEAIGIDPAVHDIRFVEDDWESPTLGAWGLGWECWCDGMEVSQFTYFQQVAGFECAPVAGELTYGLERLACYLQGVDHIMDLNFNGLEDNRKVLYRDVFLQAEQEYSRHNFHFADTVMLFEQFRFAESACRKYLDAGWDDGGRERHLMALPAYDQCIKASHVFNLLDARGVISVTERQSYILRVRELAKACGEAWLKTAGGGALLPTAQIPTPQTKMVPAMVDLITEGYLTEFSNEFGISDLPEQDRFEHLAAWLATRRHYSNSTFSPSDLVTGSGGDTGIDAIAVIVNNNLVTDPAEIDDLLEAVGYLDVTFVFVQAGRSPHFDSSKIAKLGFGVRDFFGDKQLPRNDIIKNYDAIVKALYAKAAKFRPDNPACFLYYITTGTWKGEKDLVVRADAETGDLLSKGLFSSVKFLPIGASQLHHLYRQTKNAIEREFIFEKKVVIPEISGVTSAYLGFLPAKDLLNLVCDEDKEIIKSLFYENVRDFLGLNPINQEIITTLESDTSDRFVLMNNGVTMITRTLRTTGDRFFVQDFQIVNGCQTTHVIHQLQKKLPDMVRVPFRLIHTQDENVIESVIRATNRQTEVKDDQFFAMKDFAKTLEAYFKTFSVDTRLYYERRPHQYDALDIQKIRIITHQNLVRAIGAMFLGLPHIATRTFRQLTAKVGKEIFIDSDKSEPYYASAFALFRLEQLFKNKKLESRYKAARYQLLLILRLLVDTAPLPKMNSYEIVKRANAVVSALQKEEAAEKLFAQAASILDEIAKDWNRDTIRTEPVTKSIFQKFGQTYHG